MYTLFLLCSMMINLVSILISCIYNLHIIDYTRSIYYDIGLLLNDISIFRSSHEIVMAAWFFIISENHYDIR